MFFNKIFAQKRDEMDIFSFLEEGLIHRKKLEFLEG